MLPSMQRNPEASPEFHKQGHDRGQINPFCWASAFLGAAVGIAGPSVFGTLFSNVILWLFISQGRSAQEAYAYIVQYSLSAPMAINFVADVCFALACGWVSVAYGRGARLSQGVVAGLLTVLFLSLCFSTLLAVKCLCYLWHSHLEFQFSVVLLAPICFRAKPNMALNLAPFGRWTLRDKAAQRRLALR